MKLVCRYCGHIVRYQDGVGWFPERAYEMENHLRQCHERIFFTEKRDADGEKVLVYEIETRDGTMGHDRKRGNA